MPDSRKGKLDAGLLATMGLTHSIMEKIDALFFYQLLLPMCNPARSGILHYPRLPFYSEVEKFLQLYAIQVNLGGTYRHSFNNLNIDELVCFDGVVVRDGVRGGSNGGIHRRWMYGSDFDSFVSARILYSRWLAVKRVIKLFNNDTAPKRGEAGYNPAYKLDMIYNTIIKNTNAITDAADLDQCGDETTWGHGGYGEAGSGLVERIMGKMGISKGGHIVITSDINRN